MPYRWILGTTILIVLHILHTCAILKSKRSLNESQVGAEEVDDVIYEEETFHNVTCRAMCTTQWRNDFEVCFNLSYDSKFFDLPLHPLFTSSLDNFERYCNLTEELLSCFADQCYETLPESDWSPGNHLCVYQKEEFIDAFYCLNLTNAMVTKHCDRQCERIAISSRNQTKERLEAVQLNLTAEETSYYSNMNFYCHDQFCLFECQKKLIKTLCSRRDRQRATHFLIDYVTWKMDHTLRALEDVGNELLFPEFCHRLLPEDYDGATEIQVYRHSRPGNDPVIQLLSSSSESISKA